jgi:hypothetical protein
VIQDPVLEQLAASTALSCTPRASPKFFSNSGGARAGASWRGSWWTRPTACQPGAMTSGAHP